MKMKKGLLFLTVMLLALMVVGTACSNNDTGPGTTDPGTTDPATTPGDTTPAVDGDYSDDYYTITLTASFPLYTDPAVAVAAIEYVVCPNIYDPLVFAELNGEIVPHVAESWDVSEDGLTYTFKIREGIKFHDGSELNAEDVAYSMTRLLEIGQGYSYLYSDYVESAVATDEYTVQFNMKQVCGPFIKSLAVFCVVNKDLVEANYAASGSYGDKGDYGTEYLYYNDAGSGPYTLSEYVMGERLLATKYDGWFKGFEDNVPKFLRVISSVDAVTIKTLMNNRTLTIADEWQSLDTVNTLDQIEGVDVAPVNIGQMASIEMNTKAAPMDDVHFRRALSYLFNYEVATTQIYPDATIPYGPISVVYDGVLQETPMEYNLQKAEEELKQSKYYNDLASYPVDLYWLSDVPDQEKLSLLLKSEAEKLGINVNIVKTTFMNAMELAASVETAPHMMISYPSASYSDASAVLLMRYHSSNSGTFNQFEWLLNDEIDAAIEDAINTLDDQARYAKYQDIERKLIDLAPTIWMFESPEMRAYQSGYVEWKAAEYAASGEFNCPIIGRYVYLPEMKIFPERRAALLGQ